MNQWRSAMFKPNRFFNASNCLYTQADYRRFLEDLGSFAPRVIIFSLDFYTFNPRYDEFFKNVSYGGLDGLGSSEIRRILRSLFADAARNPTILWPFQREPLYGVPALGLHAARTGTGFRIDGSYQYGAILRQRPDAGSVSIEGAVARVTNGTVPFLTADHMNADRRAEFERFVSAARARGIKMIAITMPFAPQIQEALDRSTRHGIQKEFQNRATADWIRRLGVTYFNFSDLDSFGGLPEEFVDPFHPSEKAYLRMLLTMLRDPDVSEFLSDLDRTELERRLADAKPYEVYQNEF